MLGLQSDDPVTRYRVLMGLNYAGLRREPGEIVTDIPDDSRQWLLDQGCIEAVQTVREGGDIE